MSWLTDLVDQHAELESPKSFWYWSGLCALSAVVQDNVWLDKYAYNLYPNIYVMLHADSGLKKGPPVGLAKRLVNGVGNTRVISGRSSVQGILRELGTGQTAPGGKTKMKSTGFIAASEFSSSLVADPAAMTILTDLYDRNYNSGNWQSLLKQESFTLKDPCLSLLVATNEAHFEDFIEAKDMHGGFIGRMFIIAEKEVHRLNPLIRKMDCTPDIGTLVSYLKEVAKCHGPFRSMEDTEAGDYYEQWYVKFYTEVTRQRIKDETGTIQRLGDSVLKVALLLSLADSTDMVIELSHIKEAISVCERLIGNVRITTHGKQEVHASAQQKAIIVKELINRNPSTISRVDLLKKYYLRFNADELTAIMDTFDGSGLITTSMQGNQVIYTMPSDVAEEHRRYLRGENA